MTDLSIKSHLKWVNIAPKHDRRGEVRSKLLYFWCVKCQRETPCWFRMNKKGERKIRRLRVLRTACAWCGEINTVNVETVGES